MAARSQKPPPPKQGTRRNRDEEVLAAAIEIFHHKGYASTSIQDVADRVGVLKGSLYHYIDSKEELLARIFEESDRQSFELMTRVQELDIPAVDRLYQFAKQWSLWYLENVERASLYFNEWKHLTGKRLTRVIAKRHDYEARVGSMIEDVKRDGEADPDLDTRYACFFLLSAISGLPVWYKRRGPDNAEHIAEAYADMTVAMVRKKPIAKKTRKGR
jgi:TetR/AcrR family transcriptional regulator, cholesterol catabolism regulator